MAAKPANADEVVLKLQEQISGPAERAMGALARLENQMAREQNALGRLNVDMTRARSKLEALTKAGPKSQDKKDIDAHAESMFKQQRVISLLNDRMGGQRDRIDKLRESHRKLSNPVKQNSLLHKELSEALEKSTKDITYMGAAGGIAGAAVAAGLAVASAAVVTLIGLFAKAIGSSGEMREEFLNLQAASVQSAWGFGWMWSSLRASTGAATMMQNAVNGVAAASGRARSEIAGNVAELYQWGLRGKNLEKGLKAIDTVATATDGKLSQSAMNQIKWYGRMGLSIDAIADRIDKKFGGVAREKALSLDKQMMRLGQNLKFIFGGADIAPLLRALDTVLRLFNSNTDSAKGMREAITFMTETAIGLILRLGIVLLKAYIWLREHDAAWRALKIAVILVAVGVGMLSVGLLLLVGVLTGLAIAVESVSMLFMVAFGAAVTWVIAKVASFFGIGGDMMTGLASGIESAADVVWKALSSVVGGAIDKAKNLLLAHSDSKVFVDIGRDVPHGFATGIEGEEGSVTKATTSMVKASTDAASTSGGAGGGGGKASAEFHDCHFYGDITEDKMRQMMARILEGERWGAPGGATT
jgi:hypothetical protein